MSHIEILFFIDDAKGGEGLRISISVRNLDLFWGGKNSFLLYHLVYISLVSHDVDSLIED